MDPGLGYQDVGFFGAVLPRQFQLMFGMNEHVSVQAPETGRVVPGIQFRQQTMRRSVFRIQFDGLQQKAVGELDGDIADDAGQLPGQ